MQNAEDNTYAAGDTPSLELVLTKEDITGVGAPATLILFNNEVGFQEAHVQALCSVGMSTKKGQRNSGYIGEKGTILVVQVHPSSIELQFQVRHNSIGCNENRNLKLKRKLNLKLSNWFAGNFPNELILTRNRSHLHSWKSSICHLPLFLDLSVPCDHQV